MNSGEVHNHSLHQLYTKDYDYILTTMDYYANHTLDKTRLTSHVLKGYVGFQVESLAIVVEGLQPEVTLVSQNISCHFQSVFAMIVMTNLS